MIASVPGHWLPFTFFIDSPIQASTLLESIITLKKTCSPKDKCMRELGERGGSVVERRIPEREVGGFETYLRRVVSLSKTLYSPKVLVIPRKRWLRLYMTEQLLTGTFSLNTNKKRPKSMRELR